MYHHDLKKVHLTLLSDKQCKKYAFLPKTETDEALYVNTKRELCGGHINNISVDAVFLYKNPRGPKFGFSQAQDIKGPKIMSLRYKNSQDETIKAKKASINGLMIGGQDTCQGDSGGPLWVEENGKAILVGLVSRGRGCAYANFPGIFTRHFILQEIFFNN